jgi:chromosome partitioning protein
VFHVKHFPPRSTLFHVKHHKNLPQRPQAVENDGARWYNSGKHDLGRQTMGKIIAVANQKGGVGKTTTCVNLTCALKKRGRRVLLIDCDPQGNSTSGMGVDKTVTPNCYDLLMNGAAAADCIRSTKYGDVLPANMNLSGCSVELVGSERREYIMKNALAPVQADYDFILIDCPPSLELLTINALVAADSVLIPVQCEYYALEGIADLMRSIKMCNKRLNPELSVQGIVMTMYDGRTKLSDQVVNEVRKFFGKKVYKTMIPRNVRLSEAPSHRKPAIAYDKESKGARAYLHLAGELIKREEKAAKAAQEAAASAAKEAEHG